MSFRVWLISLSIMSSRFSCAIHTRTHTHTRTLGLSPSFGCCQWCCCHLDVWISVESLLSVPLRLYPEVRLLGYWCFCLTFWAITPLLPPAAAYQLIFPSTVHKGCIFSTSLSILIFVSITTLTSVKWRCAVALTYVSLMTKLTLNVFSCAFFVWIFF